eukprot:scaffold15825_cov85-Skeletonema_dohrnii-CCMP3373.AAC.4
MQQEKKRKHYDAYYYHYQSSADSYSYHQVVDYTSLDSECLTARHTLIGLRLAFFFKWSEDGRGFNVIVGMLLLRMGIVGGRFLLLLEVVIRVEMDAKSSSAVAVAAVHRLGGGGHEKANNNNCWVDDCCLGVKRWAAVDDIIIIKPMLRLTNNANAVSSNDLMLLAINNQWLSADVSLNGCVEVLALAGSTAMRRSSIFTK